MPTADSFTVILNKGESYAISTLMSIANPISNTDGLMGAHVTSSKPISVSTLSYANIAAIPNFQDLNADQLVPVNELGKTHVCIEGKGTSNMERPCIVATYDNTSITVNGTLLTTINTGEYHLIDNSNYIGTTHKNMLIETSKPCVVGQYLAGDIGENTGGMSIIPPLSCFLPTEVNNIAHIERIGTKIHTGNISVVTSAGATVTINGSPLPAGSGPETTSDGLWDTYKITNISGTNSIQSTGALAVGNFGSASVAGYYGFYSGFGTVPKVQLSSLSNCAYGDSSLWVHDVYDTYQWHLDGTPIAGANAYNYFPPYNASGDYSVYVTRAACGEMSDTVFLHSISAVTANPDETICVGETVNLNASGATNYTWDNGLGGGASHSVSPVTNTSYIVTATDVNNCISRDTVPVAVNTLPIVDAGINQSICEGDNVTLNGAGATSYSWDNGVTDGVPFSPAAGSVTYTVTGTDANGCENTDNVDVDVYAAPSLILVPNDPITCATTTGSIDVIGIGTGDVTWTGTSSGSQTGVTLPYTISSLGAGSYNISFTDGNGCISVVYTENLNDPTPPPAPVITPSGPTTICVGESVTLTSSEASGNTWSTTETTNSIVVSTTGVYTVTYTDLSGCSSTSAPVAVTVNALPTVDAGLNQSICDGNNATLNGTGAATYTWDNGVTDGVPFSPAVGTITYTVTGTDANGCENTDVVDVTVNTLPTVDAGLNQTICDGDNVTLNGAGATTYTWDNGVTDGVAFTPAVGTVTYTVTGTDGNGCENTDVADITVNALPAVGAGLDQTICDGDNVTLNGSGATSYTWDNGVTDGVAFTPAVGTLTYTVTGTDANGCENTDVADVIVNALPAVNAGLDQSICDGNNITLSGTGATSYTWDNGVTDGVPFTQALGTTTYTVTGTDANGCENTDFVDVTVNALPIVDAGLDQTICDGDNVTLNGSGAATYTWDNGVTDGVAFTPAVGTVTYTVTGTDANGCENTDVADILVNALPIVDAGLDLAICDGDNVTLNGSGATSYTWDNGVTDGVAFMPSVGTITYTVTGTDANGCENTDVADVTVNALPVIDAGLDQAICDGDNVTLHGAGAVAYSWDNGVTNGVPFTPSVGTITYTVTGTDGNGCENTDVTDVTVFALPPVDAGLDQEACDGDNVTLNGSGATTYSWDNSVLEGIAFTPSVGTVTYTVTGTDANGCVNTDQVDVTVHALPVVDAGLDQEVCDGDDVTLNGAGAVTYVWDNAVTDGVAFIPSVGTLTYTVTGTDDNGCINTDDIDVTVHALPPVTAGPDQSVCDGESVTLSGSGATSYTWDNAISDGVAFTPAVGTLTYTVTGTDDNGCINTDIAVVTVYALPNVEAGLDQTVCEGDAVILSGTGAEFYSWDNGVMNDTAFVPSVGTTMYTVTGADTNGCINIDSLFITVNVAPIADEDMIFAGCYQDGPIDLLDSLAFTTYPTHFADPYSNGELFASEVNTVGLGAGEFTYAYVFEAPEACPNDTSFITLNLEDCSIISIPQLFTPNGDGTNDFFVIEGVDYNDGNHLTIFNRWGNVVFESTNYKNDWNGESYNVTTVGDGPLPIGTYYYVLDLNNGTDPYKGFIYLNR